MGIATATEKRFMRTVIQFARLHRWDVYHTLDSRGSEDGFCDCVFKRGPEYVRRIVVAELKTETGIVTPAQEAWLEAFSTVCPTFLWRPSHWPEIQRVLGASS